MKNRSLLFILCLVALLKFSGCSDDGGAPVSNVKLLVIDQGALSVAVGGSTAFTAKLVSAEGEEDVTSKVQWSENSESASFSSNNLNITGAGVNVLSVKASYTENGINYEAYAPVTILQPSAMLVVAPAGILVFRGSVDLQLNTFFKGKNAPSGYTYSSSDATIASVNSLGLVSFKKAGECVITVEAQGITPAQTMQVPVIVVEVLSTDFEVLPITKIELTPPSEIVFLNDKITLEAKAYNSKGDLVNPEGGITWSVESIDDDPEEGGNPAIGVITPNANKCEFNANGRHGRARITASALGISTHAEIFVSPEFVMFINPLMISMAPGESKQFQLETYPVDKTTMELKTTPVANPVSVGWTLLDFGSNIFSIGTVDNTGKVTLKNDAAPGMLSLLIASVQDIRYAPGVSQVTVAIASGCDCGTSDTNAVSIDVDNSAINASLMAGTPVSRPATVKDAFGQAIAGAEVKYCSSNTQVANVSSNGTINFTSPGSAVIKVCHGTLTKEINVTVTF